MRLREFALERYFARWEFEAELLLCSSDVEGWSMAELLRLADDETRRRWETLGLGYTESTGDPALRAEIASLYEHVSADDVLVFAGAEEAIFALHNVLLEPGDHAIVVWPAYQSLAEVAVGAGADVSPLRLHESNAWRLDPIELAACLRPSTRLVLLNEPHSPTGALTDRSTFDRVAALAAESGARLVVDEVYRFLELSAADRLPAAADVSDSAVSIGVMSKSFALAGLRIGWIATRDRDLLRRLAAFKDYTTICSSAPSEVLALIALRARETVLRRSREIVEPNLALLDAFFDRQAERLAWIRPRGGTVGFPRLLAKGVSIEAFADELVASTGVLILPGTVFGDDKNHFRIGFGRTNMPEALARFEEFVERRLQG